MPLTNSAQPHNTEFLSHLIKRQSNHVNQHMIFFEGFAFPSKASVMLFPFSILEAKTEAKSQHGDSTSDSTKPRHFMILVLTQKWIAS